MTFLDYLNQNIPVRKTEAQKDVLRNYILETAKKRGLSASVEHTKDGKNKNIVVGDPITAKAVFTAHYDTPARSLFPNIMMPKHRVLFYAYQFVPVIFLLAISFLFAYIIGHLLLNDERAYFLTYLAVYYLGFFVMMRGFQNKNNYNDNTSGVATLLSIIDSLSPEELQGVSFIFFDNEEKGKKGSAAFFKDHKTDMEKKFLLNFDCVGNGENVIFIAQKDAVASQELEILKSSFASNREFSVDFCTYKNADSNSDHKNFPQGVACVACKKSKRGVLYTPYIHTDKDIVANNSNIEFLSKNTCVFIHNLLNNS